MSTTETAMTISLRNAERDVLDLIRHGEYHVAKQCLDRYIETYTLTPRGWIATMNVDHCPELSGYAKDEYMKELRAMKSVRSHSRIAVTKEDGVVKTNVELSSDYLKLLEDMIDTTIALHMVIDHQISQLRAEEMCTR